MAAELNASFTLKQGVVTTMRPVLPAATGIKVLDRPKSALDPLILPKSES